MFTTSNAPFFRPFKVTGDVAKDRSGGWVVGQLGLNAFYADHLEGRNHWSHTNCGFDLAQYKGTTMTLYPAKTVDYIFWYDTDYGNYDEFKTLVSHIHPALLINAPHTTVVLSKETTGHYRPKRVRIPPPTVFGNKWSTMSDWSARGLAVFAISVIDFQFPWIHPGLNFGSDRPYDMYDYAGTTGNTLTKVMSTTDKWKIQDMWWNNKQGSTTNRADVWYAQWPGWSSEPGTISKTVYDAIALGPFVKKQQFAECQLVLTYRSHWNWGGDILTLPEKVCDPKTGAIPKLLKGGEPCDPSAYITAKDVDKDGFINPERWAQLTKSPPTTSGFNAHVRAAMPPEETQENPVSDETSSESEFQSPERPRRPRRRVDGGRIRELFRLRHILKMIENNRRCSI